MTENTIERLKYVGIILAGSLLFASGILSFCETRRFHREKAEQAALPSSSVSGTPDPAKAVQQSPSRGSFMPDSGLPPQAVPELWKLTRVELNTYIAVCSLYRYPVPVAVTEDQIKALTLDRLAEIHAALISLQQVRKQSVNGRIHVTRPKFLTMLEGETYRPEVGFPAVQ